MCNVSISPASGRSHWGQREGYRLSWDGWEGRRGNPPECYSPPAAALAESRGRGSQPFAAALSPPIYLALLLVFLLIVKAKPKKASEDAPKDPEMTE